MTPSETLPLTMTPKAKDAMTKEVLTVDKDERLQSVVDLMQQKGVSKVVVAEKGHIVGIVTDGDIADELGAIKNRGVPAAHLHASSAMRRKFQTAAPETELREVAALLLADDAGIVPIVHDRICVGVVTLSDLLARVESPKPIGDVMHSPVYHVAPSDRVIHARRTMMDHHVERLPVLDGGKILGVVGEGDIARGLARFKADVKDSHQPAALQRFLVEDIYRRGAVTASAETSAKDAAAMMRAQDVGCLPIVRGEKVVGIVTRSDLVKLARF